MQLRLETSSSGVRAFSPCLRSRSKALHAMWNNLLISSRGRISVFRGLALTSRCDGEDRDFGEEDFDFSEREVGGAIVVARHGDTMSLVNDETNQSRRMIGSRRREKRGNVQREILPWSYIFCRVLTNVFDLSIRSGVTYTSLRSSSSPSS